MRVGDDGHGDLACRVEGDRNAATSFEPMAGHVETLEPWKSRADRKTASDVVEGSPTL